MSAHFRCLPIAIAIAIQATLLSSISYSLDEIAHDPPIPAIPDEMTQQCPPFNQLQATNSSSYLPCPIVAQAGVPFNGWIATIRWCGPNTIEGAGAQSSFVTQGPLDKYGYPNYTTEQFDTYYEKNTWPQKEHLGGMHVWRDFGQYSIEGQGRVECVRNGIYTFNFPAFVARATIFEPVAPSEITAAGKQAAPGYLYSQFGTVKLVEAAPASGTLVLLTTERPNVVDIQTNFATTGLQGAGTNIVYSSTYAYIPPGHISADFNLLVAASANVGEVIVISAKCVGVPGNYSITNQCNAVNKTPKVLKLKIAP
ncbi:MAG: hypothetical protein ACLPSY_09170 [Steroidobacteraceae bacterium]